LCHSPLPVYVSRGTLTVIFPCGHLPSD